MANIATSQLITKYYDLYRDTEIIFSKEVLHTLRVDPRQIYVKCNGGQWPCIINSASFQMVKIIVGTNGGAFAEITKKDLPQVQLRYCFIEPDNTPLAFFVSGKVSGVTPYMNAQNLAVVTLSFTQRPPDDLILKLGTLIEANRNSVQRREERIVITPDSLRKLGLEKEETIVHIQNVPRRCILRDLSFGGAKVIILGIVKFLVNKEAVLTLKFLDPAETLEIRGIVKSAEPIQGRQDIAAVSIVFNETYVSMNYKMHINNYLTNTRKSMLGIQDKVMPQQQVQNAAATQQPAARNAAATAQPQTANAAAAPSQPQAATPQQPPASPAANKAENANAVAATTATSEKKAAAMDDIPLETEVSGDVLGSLKEESFDEPSV